MMVAAIIMFAWTAACWFSGPFERPFLGLPLFGVDPVVSMSATLLWTLAALVIRALRSGAESWRRAAGWAKQQRRVLALLAAILLIHLLLQIPSIIMYRGSNDSDSAIHGLAGYHIAEGKSRPMFRYRHNYVGSLIPHLAAALQLLFGKSPVLLRVVHTAFFTGFIVVLFALVRRLFDDHTALLAAALAAIPPYEVFCHLNHASLSATLFLGVLSLYLLSRMLEAEKPSWRQYFWYGAVLGIGFWTHLMTVYFAAAGVLALFIKDKLFFARSQFPAAPAGFVIGSAVTFIHSYYTNWSIFTRFFTQATAPSGWVDRLLPGISEFFKHCPVYLGLLGDYGKRHLFGHWVSWPVLAVFAIAFVLYLFRCREQIGAAIRLRNISIGPALFALFIPAVIIIFAVSEHSAPPAPMRYLYPLWAAIPVVIAAASFSVARWSRIAGASLAGVFIMVFLGSLAIKHLELYEREQAYQRWEEFCRRQQITRFYGQYWRSYLTSFFTAERIIGSDSYHTGHEPFSLYRQIVADSAEAPAFLFGPRERSRQAALEATLRGLGIDYRKSGCALGIVIHNLSERATPQQLANIRRGRHQATFADWTVRAVTGPGIARRMRMLSLRIVNAGDSAWLTNGRNGYVELKVSTADGRELRLQPLVRDVEPGEEISWRILLDSSESGGMPVDVEVRLNDFLINADKRPLAMDLTPATDAEPISFRELDVIRTDSPRRNSVVVDYGLFSGWGRIGGGGGSENQQRWSGGPESVLGFVIYRQRSLDLVLRLFPFRGETISAEPQRVRIFCNDLEISPPVYLPGQRRVVLNLPEHYLRVGINTLRFVYEHVERRYVTVERDPRFRFRPRAVAIKYVGFRRAGRN